ncbi:MAG: inosine/xanthosine triphosphatase [Candidatus Diapherotrites archaeon]|uniref:Probable inosine/xanthosine triphosphatase n=1 Tax=Candidatus Iainarchaeum sp. TaxID=3101447 RepID=A0A938YSB3_9ARCH|nr:inosine/xanthosine triphosphatase [Candidatus Diapherotrites archaeon]
MLVVVGSRNKAKLKAVESAFMVFGKKAEIKGFSVKTGVPEQPLSLKQTVQGAINRAKNAWEKGEGKCDFSVGIESGLGKVPHTKTGYMDFTANAVFDGKSMHLGLNPCFEYPEKFLEKILKEGKEVSDVALELWGENLRDEQGAIGRLSMGRMPRHRLHEAGLIMALMQVFNKKYYG